MALRPSRSSKSSSTVEVETAGSLRGSGLRPVEIPRLQPGQICAILSNGRLPQLPRRNVFLRSSKAWNLTEASWHLTVQTTELVVLSGSSWHCEAGYGAGHLVVRAAGPQGANVRQAANVEPRTACGIKGRRLSTVSVPTHSRIAYARSPGTPSRRAHSPSLAKTALLRRRAGFSKSSFKFSRAQELYRGQALYGCCNRVCLVYVRRRHDPGFHPAECFAGVSVLRASGATSARRGSTGTGAHQVQ